ncbi:MAG: hypothetical protein PWP39_1757 [Pyrococcus sp.]|uniref:hypothetical protein n=1 Tax=Pyrococcus sp. TaxID=33866 RepID=UPI002583C87D|nr:hypothetical protein [Pyrococcus sp.]MDK2870522.1 hypothetical protein [Pyrococcus sp.]
MQWKLVSVLLLGLLVLSSSSSATVPSKDVSPALAEKVARSYVQWIAVNIPDFKEWRDATLGKPVTYYFPNGEKSAYEFAVFKNGKNVGFILVSARKDMPPVLEFSKAKPPSWKLEKVKELAEKKGYKTGRLLYYGALTYSVDIGNGKAISLKDMKVRKYLINVKLQFTNNLESSLGKSSIGIYTVDGLVIKSISGVPAWTSTDYGGAYYIDYPDNVGPASDPWDDWDGCAAIAASMIIAYYEPQLQDDWNREAIIDVLHHTMNIDYNGGSYWWDQVEGIKNFKEEWDSLTGWIVSDPVYHDFTATFYEEFSSYDIITEVNTNHPFMLGIENPGSAHAVTGVGYVYSQESGDILYIKVHDGDEVKYITNGNWQDADMIKVRTT